MGAQPLKDRDNTLECPLHSMGSGTQTGHWAWQWHPYPLSLLVVPTITERCSSVIVANLMSIAKTKNPWQSIPYDSVKSKLKCGPQCYCVAGGKGQGKAAVCSIRLWWACQKHLGFTLCLWFWVNVWLLLELNWDLEYPVGLALSMWTWLCFYFSGL